MKMKLSILLMMLVLPAMLLSQGVTVSTDSGLDVILGGEVELEFVDVEGKGGFTHQDLTYQKVKNRSPHMRIDMAILSARVIYSENLYYQIEYRFNDERAYVDKQYAHLKVPSLNSVFEIGKDRPFVSTQRRSEGYPLIGTAFWKGREAHITSETKFKLGGMGLIGGLSFAMKRPLGTDDAAEDKSFKMMVYGDYEPKNGQTFEYGVKLGVQLFERLDLLGWYYTGELIDDWDWKASLKQSLAPYDEMKGDVDDKTHYWYGGRADLALGGFDLRGEYIEGQDGLLGRYGYYGEGSYSFGAPSFLPVQKIRLLGRYGILRLRPGEQDNGDFVSWAYLSEAMSWNRDMTTLSMLIDINDNLTLKVEHYLLGEETGSASEPSVDDNQSLLQVNFKF